MDQASAARFATPDDIRKLFMQLLGRQPEPRVFAANQSRALIDLAIEVAQSAEFQANVAAQAFGPAQISELTAILCHDQPIAPEWLHQFSAIIGRKRIGPMPLARYLAAVRAGGATAEAWTRQHWPPVAAPDPATVLPKDVTLLVPTVNSAAWIADLVALYSQCGIRPLFAVDRRSNDGTERILTDLGADWVQVSGDAPRVEAVMPLIVAAVSTPWILRLDDDEFLTKGLCDYLPRAIADAEHDAFGLPRLALRLDDDDRLVASRFIAFGPDGEYDRQWRLFRRDAVGFDTRLHTAGIVFTSGRRAPPEAALLHFDWVLRSAEQREQKFRSYAAQDPKSALENKFVGMWESIPQDWHMFEDIGCDSLRSFALSLRAARSAITTPPVDLTQASPLENQPETPLEMTAEMPLRTAEDRTTICFTTVDRPYAVQRLLRSIRARYPRIHIIVAEQNVEIPADLLAVYQAERIEVVTTPFDCGVSVGRNMAVERATTEFVLICDDDFLFCQETDIELPITILDNDRRVDIVGGSLRDLVDSPADPTWQLRRWEAFLARDRDHRFISMTNIDFLAPRVRHVGQIEYFETDTVLNWKILRRSAFDRGARWDPRYKCNGEHEDFYLNVKETTRLGVVYCPSFYAYHHSPRDQGYMTKRNDISGWQRFALKWDVDECLQPLKAFRAIYARQGHAHIPQEQTASPLLNPSNAVFAFEEAAHPARASAGWPVTFQTGPLPHTDRLEIAVSGAEDIFVQPGDAFSLLCSIRNPTPTVLAALGPQAPRIGWRNLALPDAGSVEVFATQSDALVQDLCAGVTLHVMNVRTPQSLAHGSQPQFGISLISPEGEVLSNEVTVQLRVAPLAPLYPAKLEDGWKLSQEGFPDFLQSVAGLSQRESWGRWSDANLHPFVEMTFNEALPEHFVLELTCYAFGPNAEQPARLIIGDTQREFSVATTPTTTRFDLAVGPGVKSFRIIPANPTAPSAAGLSKDVRKLGLALFQMRIEPKPPN